MEIKVQGNYITKIDPEDYERWGQHCWFLSESRGGKKYVRVYTTKGRGRVGKYLHRLIAEAPKGTHVDHINGDSLDNRRSNLRYATQSQNIANSKPRIGGTSRFKGVHWNKRAGRWAAAIKINYKSKYLGLFDTEQEAAEAYRQAAHKHFGDFARLD